MKNQIRFLITRKIVTVTCFIVVCCGVGLFVVFYLTDSLEAMAWDANCKGTGGPDCIPPPYSWPDPCKGSCPVGYSKGGTDCQCCFDEGCNGGCKKVSIPCDCKNHICCEVDCVDPDGCNCPTCSCGDYGDDTGEYCDYTIGCGSCTDDCGVRHGCGSKTCWDPETNFAPPAPERIYVCYDGVPPSNCIELSQDADDRTLIPMPDDDMYIMTSTVGIPAGSNSRGMRYAQRIDFDDGNWDCANTNDVCQGPRVEHYTTDIQNSIGLVEGAVYHVWGHAVTLDRCTADIESTDWGPAVHGYFKINTPPEVTSIRAVNTECSDYWTGLHGNGANNPLSIRAIYTDADGGDHIDRVFVALALDEGDDQGDAGCGSWERKLGQTFALYYNVDSGSYNIVQDEPPASGCPWDYSGASGNSRFDVESISHSISGNMLTLHIQLKVDDGFPNGEFNFFGMAKDRISEYSCLANPGSACWDEKSQWKVDLAVPDTRLTIDRVSGDVADILHFRQWAADDRSGLKRVFDRHYWVIRDGEETETQYNIGDQVTFVGSEPSWSELDDYGIGGFQGGDKVSGQIMAQDMACNVSVDPRVTRPQIGQEWMLTKFYDTYAACGYDNPIPSSDVPFSTYWIGGDVSTPWKFGVANPPSLNKWESQGYDDSNRVVNWYDRLYGLAMRSEWLVENDMVSLDSVAGSTIDQSSPLFADGIFIYTNGGTLTITGNCKDRKVLFVSRANVNIVPDMTTADNSACLLIAKNKITILPGGNASNAENEDIIEAAFITDGKFTSQGDPNFDKLKIRGFVFAKETIFERDLVFEENSQYPAEKIVYDPRYIYLLRDMLGRRPFSQFECGIVKSDFCLGW